MREFLKKNFGIEELFSIILGIGTYSAMLTRADVYFKEPSILTYVGILTPPALYAYAKILERTRNTKVPCKNDI